LKGTASIERYDLASSLQTKKKDSSYIAARRKKEIINYLAVYE